MSLTHASNRDLSRLSNSNGCTRVKIRDVLSRWFLPTDLEDPWCSIKNGKAMLDLNMAVKGVPTDERPAPSRGFSIYYSALLSAIIIPKILRSLYDNIINFMQLSAKFNHLRVNSVNVNISLILPFYIYIFWP